MQISSVIYPGRAAGQEGQEWCDGRVYVWRVASLSRVPAGRVDEVFAATIVVENLMESSIRGIKREAFSAVPPSE